MNTSDALTALIALYGAILSTVLAIKEIRKDRRRVRVTCKMALTASPGGDVWEFLAIQAINIGHRPVEITMAGLKMSNDDIFFQPSSHAGPIPIPKRLEDGESVSVLFDFPEVIRAIKERSQPGTVLTEAFVNDAEGNVYKSRLPKGMKKRILSR